MSFNLAISQLIVAADKRNRSSKYCVLCRTWKNISMFKNMNGRYKTGTCLQCATIKEPIINEEEDEYE